MAAASVQTAATAEQQGSVLTADAPAAVVPARSVQTVTVTLRPTAPGACAWRLVCRTVQEGSRPVSAANAPPAEVCVARQSERSAHAIHGQFCAELARTAAEPHAAMQVATQVAAEPCHPTLQVQDVHCDDAPKRDTWAMASVPALNSLLAAPVTPHERWLRDQEANHGLHLAALMRQLPAARLCFGPVVRGYRRRVRVCFTNVGRLPAAWALAGADMRDLEVEAWVEAPRPANAAEALDTLIVENRLFEYSPMGGCLAPGESCTVRDFS